MILSFRHGGLRRLYEGRGAQRVAPDHVARLRRILAVLDQSSAPRDMDLPGLRLHALTGSLRGHYAVRVSASWRVTFGFEDGHAADVDYIDYH